MRTVKSNLAVLALIVAAGCHKAGGEKAPLSSPAPAKPRASSAPAAVGLPQDQRDRALAGLSEAERDRRLLVVPAPPNYRPASQGKRLAVTIIPKDPRLKAGTPLWLRIEVQNVGTDTVSFADYNSILKSLGASDQQWRFISTGPDGVRRRIHRPIGPVDDFVQDQDLRPVSDEEAKAMVARSRAFEYLNVDLQPGETLVSLPRTSVAPLDSLAAPEKRFVEVSSESSFTGPGRYSIEAEYRFSGWNAALRRLDAETVAASTPVEIEVVP